MTQDIEGSKKFYMELFGWTINSMDMGGGASYQMFMQGERPIAGSLVLLKRIFRLHGPIILLLKVS